METPSGEAEYDEYFMSSLHIHAEGGARRSSPCGVNNQLHVCSRTRSLIEMRITWKLSRGQVLIADKVDLVANLSRSRQKPDRQVLPCLTFTCPIIFCNTRTMFSLDTPRLTY